MTKDSHAITVDLEKILPILAKEIYNTSFAFLRENVQNAVDAVRIQSFRDKTTPALAGHRIEVTVTGLQIVIRDSGTGMSRGDLEDHYWVIGKSGKHTEEARKAGVVGTFGIGGMANFGVCSYVQITTRTELSSRAIVCHAKRDDLSASRDCVFYNEGPREFSRGTEIRATLVDPVDPSEAANYLGKIVQFLEIPVFLNGQELPRSFFRTVDDEHCLVQDTVSGTVAVRARVQAHTNGSAEVCLESLAIQGKSVPGVRAHLRIGNAGINAYQHGFLLSAIHISSNFQFEGEIDCPLFRPTAGRESVTAETQQMAQRIANAMEEALAEAIASSPALADRFTALFGFILQRQRLQLADNATIRQYGATERVALQTLRQAARDSQIYFVRDETDRTALEAVRSQGKRVAILSSESKRNSVETAYLKKFCNAVLLEEKVEMLRALSTSELSTEQNDFIARIAGTLRTSYFIERVRLLAGNLSLGAMVWAPPKMGEEMTVVIDVEHPQVQRLIRSGASQAYGGLVDVFVRDSVFPHLESAFPELRSRDFDHLLRQIQTTFEQFQIDPNDVNRLQLLARATNFSADVIARVVGVRTNRLPHPTTVRRSDVVDVSRVINAAVRSRSPGTRTPNQARTQGSSGQSKPNEEGALLTEGQSALEALRDTDVSGKLVDATSFTADPDIRGFYLALTPESHILYRNVFERRPAIDFMWGGHRAAYIVYDQGSMVLYYDVELRTLIVPTSDGGSLGRAGSAPVDREPLVTKNMVFLPIPTGFERYFVPAEAALTFVVRHKILSIGDDETPVLSSEAQ